MKLINIKGQIVGNSMAAWARAGGYDVVCPKDVLDILQEANNEDIELHINSGGGSVVQASEIYTAIKNYSGHSTAKIMGFAGSSASWVAMACNEVEIAPTGLMMAHNSSSMERGDYRSMDNSSEMLQSIDAGIRNAYKLKTGHSDEKLKEIMDNTTWMNAQQAIELKFADRIMFDNEGILSPSQVINSVGSFGTDIYKEFENFKKKQIAENNIDESVDNNKIKNKEDKEEVENLEISKEMLIENHKDIYDAILNEGVMQERERMKNIEELAVSGAENIIHDAKFENAISASEVAMNIIKAQKESQRKGLENFIEDKQDLVVDNSQDEDVMKNKEDEIINYIATVANAKREAK